MTEELRSHGGRWRPRAVALILMAGLLIASLGSDLIGADAARGRKDGKGGKAFQQFANTTTIAIPSNALATPSSIAVFGLNAPISDVDVSLNVLTHPTASDLDVLLVGPGGQMVLIMSDAGGETANDSLTFSDQAPNQLSSSDPLTSGIFQPTNYDFTTAPDTFPSPPAPVANPPGGSNLSVFNGTNGNGLWTLFVKEQDEVPVQTGEIGAGWSLRITTANGAPQASPDSFQARAGQTLTVPAAGVLENDSDPDGDALTAVLAGRPKKGQVLLEADGSFTFTAKKKAKGLDSFTYLAQDTSGLNALATVDIQIKGKKHKKGKKR